MTDLAILIGGFIRWILKACKTNLSDELEGDVEPFILKSAETENYLLGYALVAVILVLIIWIIF